MSSSLTRVKIRNGEPACPRIVAPSIRDAWTPRAARDGYRRVARHGFGGIAPWRRDCEGIAIESIARHIKDAGPYRQRLLQKLIYSRAPRSKSARRYSQRIAAPSRSRRARGCCFVLVVGGLPAGSRDLLGARSQVLDCIARLLDHARQFRVALAIEPLHPMYAADRSLRDQLSEALSICRALEPQGFDKTGRSH